MWVYIKSEPGLFTVGFYDPSGKWHPDSDHQSEEDAARRVHYLNGGSGRTEAMNQQQQRTARDLLSRCGVHKSTLDRFDAAQLRAALDAVGDAHGEDPPDHNWNREYFEITGEHVVLTDEGWVPAATNVGPNAMDVLDELNAPPSAEEVS
jgi:hypothetical protein